MQFVCVLFSEQICTIFFAVVDVLIRVLVRHAFPLARPRAFVLVACACATNFLKINPSITILTMVFPLAPSPNGVSETLAAAASTLAHRVLRIRSADPVLASNAKLLICLVKSTADDDTTPLSDDDNTSVLSDPLEWNVVAGNKKAHRVSRAGLGSPETLRS